MNCNQAIHNIYTGKENDMFLRHIESCDECKKLYEKVNHTMNQLLEEPVEIPIGLIQKTLNQLPERKGKWSKRVDFMKYVQVAAVLAAGIFIGVLLGTRADSHLLVSKKDRKDQAYSQFKEKHHFSNNQDPYIFN